MQEAAVQEAAVQETAVQETAVQETAVQETAVQEQDAAQETAEQDAVQKPAEQDAVQKAAALLEMKEAERQDAYTCFAKASRNWSLAEIAFRAELQAAEKKEFTVEAVARLEEADKLSGITYEAMAAAEARYEEAVAFFDKARLDWLFC